MCVCVCVHIVLHDMGKKVFHSLWEESTGPVKGSLDVAFVIGPTVEQTVELRGFRISEILFAFQTYSSIETQFKISVNIYIYILVGPNGLKKNSSMFASN